MLLHALAATNRGFHIFPVVRGGKVPHPAAGYRDQAGELHGWGETATNDYEQVKHFWTNVDPNANFGIACKPSQLLVVDLDIAKEPFKLRGTEWEYLHTVYGEYVDGESLFDEMEYKLNTGPREAFSTYSVRTGSGGLHLYYRWPSNWPRISQASPVKGIVDVRGNGGQWGGYVLGEGCQTEAGQYRRVPLQPPVALPPVWLRQLVAEKPPAPKIQRPKGLRQPGPLSWSGLADKVRNAGEGNRNNALVWAARTVCEEGGSESDAMATLGPAAEDAGLGAMEIERTIQSAFRTQRHKENR
ncbi:MAG TPA: bifunctional DNA primase/polymerase [Acidimicrobiia bacterium]|nr:bifunctional DNA primase/polymerase [Acidimicrobiia bacterium]